MPKFEKGRSGNPAGKKPGTPNKVTRTLKEAILLALEEAGGEGGSVAYLRSQAKLRPGAFLPLWEGFCH